MRWRDNVRLRSASMGPVPPIGPPVLPEGFPWRMRTRGCPGNDIQPRPPHAAPLPFPVVHRPPRPHPLAQPQTLERACMATKPAKTRRPNILVIFGDDIGYW